MDAALSDGGFGIQQCPYVSDILKNWGMSDCKSSATLGCHDLMTFQKNPIAILCSSGSEMCWCHVVVVNKVQT